MTKPRVLQLVDSFNQGGSERQAVQLMRLLHESGEYEVFVACLSEQGPLRREVESLGLGEIPVFPLTSFHDPNFAAQMVRFVRYLRDQKISIVQSSDFYTNIFGMPGAWLAGVPVRIAARRESGKRSALKRRIERGAYRLAQAVIANCEAVRDELIAEGVPEKKVITSYNGLELARFKPRQDLQRQQQMASLGLPQLADRRLVTMVANLRPVKDQMTFLRAARQVRDAVPDAAFCLAGEGELLEPLREQAATLGLAEDVFFPGRCEQVADLLALSDVGVLSSASEGFSNAIIEYMAAALPVVATDVGGAREAVIEGETGFLIPAGDSELLADRVVELLKNAAQAHSMGKQARQIVEEKFSSSALFERTRLLYERLLPTQPKISGPTPDAYGNEIERFSR
ncbi:MAG: glycosyltransferase [Candidatus Doudnabacteria bacterium]|nr:glycosyltransferase [Candidatus Doudnabacteria bacterium]